MDYLDLMYMESSLFENYVPKSYDDLLLALKVADEKIMSRIAATSGEWTKSELTKMKALIDYEINNTYGGIFEGMQEESVDAAKVVMSATLGATADLPLHTIKDLLNSKRNIQGYTFVELFKLPEANHARQLRVLLASGVAQGMTAQQIAREYGIKSDQLSKGQIKTNIYTTISDARDQGRYEAFKILENQGVSKGYIYDATLDSGTTVYCRDMDQKRFHKKIEDIQHLINTHFNERSRFRPIPLVDTLTGGTRPSKAGEVPEQSYESWYLQQSKSFQKSTLSNRKYNAFLKDKYKVKSIVDIDKVVEAETVKKYL